MGPRLQPSHLHLDGFQFPAQLRDLAEPLAVIGGPEGTFAVLDPGEDGLEAVDWNIEETLYVHKVRGTSPMA